MKLKTRSDLFNRQDKLISIMYFGLSLLFTLHRSMLHTHLFRNFAFAWALFALTFGVSPDDYDDDVKEALHELEYDDYDIRRHLQEDDEEEDNRGYYRVYHYQKPVGRLHTWSSEVEEHKSWSDSVAKSSKPKKARVLLRKVLDERNYGARAPPKKKRVFQSAREPPAPRKTHRDRKKSALVLVPVVPRSPKPGRKKPEPEQGRGLWEEAKMWSAFSPRGRKSRRVVESIKDTEDSRWRDDDARWRS